MRIEQFYEELEKHDWLAKMSDDAEVRKRGDRRREELRRIAYHHGIEFIKLFNEYSDYIFSGTLFGQPKRSKPKL